MTDIGGKCLRIGKNIIFALFAIIAVYLFLISLFGSCVMCYTDEHIYYLKDFALLLAAGLIFLIWLGSRIWRHAWCQHFVNGKGIFRLQILVSVLWLALMTALILIARLQPYHDPGSVYHAAEGLLQGDYTQWKQDGYLYFYPFQNGFVLLECPFLLLFHGNAYLALQLFNMLLWLSAIWAMAGLTDRLFGEKTGRLTFFLLLCFLPMWGYVTYNYGTVPGLACSIWSFVCLFRCIDTRQLRYAVLSAILMGLAVLYKSNYEIFAVAAVLLLLGDLLAEKNRNHRILSLSAILLLLACVFAALKLPPILLHQITGEDTGAGVPFIAWVAMGLQDSSIAPGWYNRYLQVVYENSARNVAIMKVQSSQSISQSLAGFAASPAGAVSFFGRKLASIWNSPAFECFTTLTKRDKLTNLPYWLKDLLYNGGIGNTILTILLDIAQSVTYFGTVLFLILRRKKLQWQQGIFALIFVGGFLFHIVWEGKCQYAVPYYVMLFPYVAAGYAAAVTGLTDYLARSKQLHSSLKASGQPYRFSLTAHIRTFWKKTTQTATGRLFLALALLVLLLAAYPGHAFDTTLKIHGNESEYLWFCTHETEWKQAEYAFPLG